MHAYNLKRCVFPMPHWPVIKTLWPESARLFAVSASVLDILARYGLVFTFTNLQN